MEAQIFLNKRKQKIIVALIPFHFLWTFAIAIIVRYRKTEVEAQIVVCASAISFTFFLQTNFDSAISFTQYSISSQINKTRTYCNRDRFLWSFRAARLAFSSTKISPSQTEMSGSRFSRSVFCTGRRFRNSFRLHSILHSLHIKNHLHLDRLWKCF